MELKRTKATWDNLPNLAISNIFCKSSIEDRLFNLPFVCKSWAHVSRDPRCWASMIADTHPLSADDAFVKASFPYSSAFPDPFRGSRSGGVLRLQMLMDRAGSGAAITSLFVYPFLNSVGGPSNDDDVLTLIACRCPNLRNLSFHGSYNGSEGVILELIGKCRKLEVIDFSDSPYFTPAVLEAVKGCCPDIRGIRRNGEVDSHLSTHLVSSSYSSGFSDLRLINLSDSTIGDMDLLNILCMKKLQYLDITRCQNLVKYMDLIKRAHGRIPEICYD
ncbi:unnamed protein product [Cuscuta epithymum]|uniref:F-box domain-containing protein n=1 Tax=Cuscuta epithymum TaxID=186058 RepID=A0AAV0DPX7_9ASTE|nr:unnamed protein product [Cuscuta epithymum]CAH9125994.1 unnamed protein product [Cuscuta epithymum]